VGKLSALGGFDPDSLTKLCPWTRLGLTLLCSTYHVPPKFCYGPSKRHVLVPALDAAINEQVIGEKN